MEWEFTPEDVVKARASYALQDFRRDLREEVRHNVAGDDPSREQRAFDLIYDMCHAQATGRELENFLAAFAYDPPTCQFLREVQPAMRDNVAMLGAILQRMIMEGIEAGMPLPNAIEEAAARHTQAVTSG